MELSNPKVAEFSGWPSLVGGSMFSKPKIFDIKSIEIYTENVYKTVFALFIFTFLLIARLWIVLFIVLQQEMASYLAIFQEIFFSGRV